MGCIGECVADCITTVVMYAYRVTLIFAVYACDTDHAQITDDHEKCDSTQKKQTAKYELPPIIPHCRGYYPWSKNQNDHIQIPVISGKSC